MGFNSGFKGLIPLSSCLFTGWIKSEINKSNKEKQQTCFAACGSCLFFSFFLGLVIVGSRWMCWSSLRSAPFTRHNLAGTTLVAGVEFVVRKEQTCNQSQERGGCRQKIRRKRRAKHRVEYSK